jgi:hypothetical protein
MSKEHSHIKKGMLLQGGAYSGRYICTPEDHPPACQHSIPDPPSLDEIKIRLQRVKEALEFIKQPESRDEWLKRYQYL